VTTEELLGEEKVIAAISVHLLTDLAKIKMKEDSFLLDEIRLEELISIQIQKEF
jgi:hypothetical protein